MGSRGLIALPWSFGIPFKGVRKWLCFLVMLSCFVSGTALAADSKATQALADQAAKRLIVQFKQGKSDPYWPDAIAGATMTPAANAVFYARLGRPIQAVKLLEGITPPKRQEELRQQPDSLRASLERYMVLVYPDSAGAHAAKVRLQDDPGVQSVSLDMVLYFSAIPNDSYFSQNPANPAPGNYQWGMQLLNLPQAWDKERGHAYIADADSGIYHDCGTGPCLPHPDLRQNFRPQFSGDMNNIIPVGTLAQDVDGHGTHVAGIIAATTGNASGVAGVCWNCSFAAFRISQQGSPSAAALSRALTFAVDHGLQVVNMSLAAPQVSCTDFPSICEAIQHANERSMSLVASAGNGREPVVWFPANVPSVMPVGGLQYDALGPTYWLNGYGNNNIACPGTGPGAECGSNYGPGVPVMAPALDIVSTVIPGGNYNTSIHCGDGYGHRDRQTATATAPAPRWRRRTSRELSD